MKTSQKILMIVLLLAVLGMAVAQWLLLPELVMMQVDLQGNAGNAMPKLAAVALPLVIGLAGVWMMRTKPDGKAIILAAAGVLIPIFTLYMNR